MLTISSSTKKFFGKKLHDPLFYLAIVLLLYWLLNAWYIIFIQGAPSRILWYSSMGLGGTSLGLFLRNRFILSSMFCVLLFQEAIWNLSFFANLFGLPDYLYAASYAFDPKFPRIALFITLFHLLILPSIVYGLYKLKKVSSKGWLGGYIFALVINYLPLIFPDTEDVNCVRGQIASCQIFFGAFYNISPWIGIFGGVTYQLFLIYIPSNILLTNIFNKSSRIMKVFQSPFNELHKILSSPNFYIGFLIFVLSLFWILDTFEKVSVQHSLSRLFWWSSTGLLLIIIGLYKRNSLLLTAMFCSLLVIEALWSVSFLSYLFFKYPIPYLQFALYSFSPNYPPLSFVVTLFHLLLVPATIAGLIFIKKASPFGWILALLYYVVTVTIAQIFPDPSENINCSRVINILCTYIFGFNSGSSFRLNLIISSLYQVVIFYIPLNLLLLLLFRKINRKPRIIAK